MRTWFISVSSTYDSHTHTHNSSCSIVKTPEYHFDIDPCLLAPLIWCKQNGTFAYHSLEKEEEEKGGGRKMERQVDTVCYLSHYSQPERGSHGRMWRRKQMGRRETYQEVHLPSRSLGQLTKAFQKSWLFFRITALFIIQRHSDSDKRVCILATMSCMLD